jgi:hypothetical protein
MATEYVTLSGVKGFWTPFENGAFTTEEDFGEIDEISLNITEEELQHISRACGSVGLPDKTAVNKTEILLDIVSPEISPKMLARAFRGTLTETEVPEGTDITANVTITELDKEYDIGTRHLSNVTVMDDTDTTTYVENVDYDINYTTGTITGITGGAITAGDEVHVTFSNSKYTSWTIAAFQAKTATGKLRLEACAVEGMDIEYTFEKVTLKLNGTYSLVSAEDWASIPFQATALSDDTITNPNLSKLINIKGDDLFA